MNFTKAANELFVAQSAVSQQIASLEKDLGIRLFVRNKRSVKLTEAGTVFLSEAVDILERAESAINKARKAEEGVIGTLKIGFLASPVRNFLPKLIQKFSQKYPTVEVVLNHLTMKELNEGIESNDLDVAFTVSLGGIHHQNTLEIETLYCGSPCVYLKHDHPLANKQAININDLANEPFIMRDREEAPQWNDYIIDLCIKNNFYPNIVTQARRIEAVLMLVDAGLGLSIFPNYLQMYKSSNILVRNIEGEENMLDVIVYRKKTNSNPTIPLFLTELKAELNNFNNPESMYI